MSKLKKIEKNVCLDVLFISITMHCNLEYNTEITLYN